jgi:hypothetical protein
MVSRDPTGFRNHNVSNPIARNPQTGLLRHQPQMHGIAFVDVDYCDRWSVCSTHSCRPVFSDWGYRKRTRIWTSHPSPPPHRLCNPSTCQNGIRDPDTGRWRGHRIQLSSNQKRSSVGRTLKYRVPPKLVAYLTGLVIPTTITYTMEQSNDNTVESLPPPAEGCAIMDSSQPCFYQNTAGTHTEVSMRTRFNDNTTD